jgi:hypothetical protein
MKNKKGLDDDWLKAKKLCRLSDEEVRMARELGMGPRGLIKNIPNPNQRWKAPVGAWVRDLYRKKFKKNVPDPMDAPRVVNHPASAPADEFAADWELFEPPAHRAWFEPPDDEETDEENELMAGQQAGFRLAADYVAAAFARFDPVRKVALFGSVASPLEKEVPRFQSFRRAGLSILHECKDLDLAVWLSDLTILKALQRARSQALNDLFRECGIGVAHHQVDVFLIEPGTGGYLGRLCNFGECPKGKPECLVKDCGAVKFLRQIEDFSLDPDALGSQRAIILFERGKIPAPSLPDNWDIPF